MFFQLPKVSNDLIKWPHKDKNQTLNDTQQLIQSAAFCLFVSPLMILIICGEKVKQVKLSCFFLGEEIRRCNNYVKENVINFRHFVSNLVDAHSPATLHIHTVWHENFAGVYFCGLASFCVLRELIFAVRTDWFFLLGINFCDFQKVPSSQH